ncbi:MAG: tetratricopeptide repeat protein [Bacteroides sp.]|nr:tetratricopeptide repeat protein [Bacteroides sp.]
MTVLENINALLRSNSLEEALKVAQEAVEHHPDNAEVLYARGKVYWRMQRRAEAITDYTASARIAPDGPGAVALEQAQAVLDFYNPDMLNP